MSESGGEEQAELAGVGDERAVGRPQLTVLLEVALGGIVVRKRTAIESSGRIRCSASTERTCTVRSMVGTPIGLASLVKIAGYHASDSAATRAAS